MPESKLSILVIDENPERAAVLESGLVLAGYTRVSVIQSSLNLLARVQAMAPDVILIDLGNPDRDALEQMFQFTREIRRPIAMFVDESDSDTIQTAVEAGVSVYVVNGLAQSRIRPIVDMAISRFNAFERLRQERDNAFSALADRKVIERAKGILMTEKRLSEEAAYKAMRRAAMQQNRKLVDIAQGIIMAHQIEC